ncbi:MAG: tetratricopeptide repeat protein, partial [Cyanobacteria bacterium J06648_10]
MTFSNSKNTVRTSSAALSRTLSKIGIGVFFALSVQALPTQAAPSTGVSFATLQATASVIPVSSTEEQRANQLANQGVQAFSAGDRTAAFNYWNQAMLLYRVADVPAKEAHMLENLSVIYRLTDRPAEAINASQQAVDIYTSLGTLDSQPSVFLNMGSAYRQDGQFDSAIAAYDNSLRLYRLTGDATGERIVLSLLADVHGETGDYRASIAFQQQV